MDKIEKIETPFDIQRKEECRICPECEYEVTHPFVERCPRCYAVLPQLDLNCSGCMHRVICPVGKK